MLRTCAEQFGLDDIRAATPEPVVFPLGEGGAWAYEVRFRVLEDAADVRAYLRADDLAVLLASNLASATGARGLADPLTTPEAGRRDARGGAGGAGRLLRGRSLDVVPAAGGQIVRGDRDPRRTPHGRSSTSRRSTTTPGGRSSGSAR